MKFEVTVKAIRSLEDEYEKNTSQEKQKNLLSCVKIVKNQDLPE